MLKLVYSILTILCLLSALTGQAHGQDKPRAYINGQWYDGKGFRPAVFYTLDGKLTRRKPKGEIETVDLKGGYVVPPLADAHCHHFDNEMMVKRLTPIYIKDGIFYAQCMGNWRRGRKAVAALVNRPDGVDVAYADASLTATLGHPYLTYEMAATGNWSFDEKNIENLRTERKGEGDAYYFVETPALLEKVWTKILADPPDLIKILLLDSARYAETYKEQRPGAGGLPPEIVPEIVQRAHAIGRKVYAHVETAYDVQVAVRAGVDGFAHLAGYAMGSRPAEQFLLDEKDVQAFGRRNGIVQPTAWLAQNYTNGDAEALKRVQEAQKRNFALLKKHRVRLAIGSDSYGTNSWSEALYLRELGVYSDAELLKIWVETTPQTIFPRRKIGRLADGYEASFLVLPENPMNDLRKLRNIALRVKQGVVLPEPKIAESPQGTGATGSIPPFDAHPH